MRDRPPMMDHHGMMGGMRERGMMGHGMMGPAMMRMMLSLMDSDGDGTVSLTEFQAAHERMFKAADANKDGRLSFDEVRIFLQGAAASAEHHER
ncbi:MAG: EF-hand domain-containing protein [Hyphomicrobiales bacterium]|nr:EF-hand domain-containing protein [Hyphomicrobiales bacterium]